MNFKKMMMAGAVALSLGGCATMADLAGADSHTLSLTAAQSYGAMIKEAQANKTLDTSSTTYRRINTVFQRMKPFADQQNRTGVKFDWQLAVLKSDQINAFVAPGGKVVFYTSIVDKLALSDDEISAIMGHEMVHALEEHAKSKIGAQALTSLAINVGKAYAGNAIGEAGSMALDLGSQVGVGLPYSRSLESQADLGGLMLMARAGYNPNAAITLWQKMAKQSGNSSNSAFLSTHPSNTQRIAAMQKTCHKPSQFIIL